MSKVPLQAFNFEYNGLSNTLVTPVIVIPDVNPTQERFADILSNSSNSNFLLNALWDTGATASCIKPQAAKRVGIDNNFVTYARVRGVNSKEEQKPVYRVGAFILPNRVNIPGVHLIESDIASEADILIGMDIILLGDLSISNYGGKTVFCFSMPPHENIIDLVERSNKVNSKIKKR